MEARECEGGSREKRRDGQREGRRRQIEHIENRRVSGGTGRKSVREGNKSAWKKERQGEY